MAQSNMVRIRLLMRGKVVEIGLHQPLSFYYFLIKEWRGTCFEKCKSNHPTMCPWLLVGEWRLLSWNTLKLLVQTGFNFVLKNLFYELALFFNLFQARKFDCIAVSLSSTLVPKACTSRMILGHKLPETESVNCSEFINAHYITQPRQKEAPFQLQRLLKKVIRMRGVKLFIILASNYLHGGRVYPPRQSLATKFEMDWWWQNFTIFIAVEFNLRVRDELV